MLTTLQKKLENLFRAFDGDGGLAYDEVAAVLRDFCYSDDPSIPASSWLGPVA